MPETSLPLAELLAKVGDAGFPRAVAEAVLQSLMDADIEGVMGAARHERTQDRQTYRNGFRDRALDSRLGTLQLRLSELRQGTYFPPFLEARKMSEKALVAVIQKAWISGVPTRQVHSGAEPLAADRLRRQLATELIGVDVVARSQPRLPSGHGRIATYH